jgi:hypothetical protein
MNVISDLMVLAVALCTVVGCLSANSGGAKPLTLYDAHRQLIAQLATDGTITDGAAHVVTRYDAAAHAMPLRGATLDVAQSVRVTGPRELDVRVGAIGPWHVRVLPSNDIEVDGQPFAHVDGVEASTAGMFWLGVLLCALPMIDPPHRPSADAALPSDPAPRPPPPAPPIPR